MVLSSRFSQGGLNKEIQLNLCKIFSILIFNELYLFAKWLKLERAVTFLKYLAGAVSLIFLKKTLIWTKVRRVFPKNYQYSIFYPIYHWLL